MEYGCEKVGKDIGKQEANEGLCSTGMGTTKERGSWFAKGTELSWISNYCISLIEIQSKLKTLSRSQALLQQF